MEKRSGTLICVLLCVFFLLCSALRVHAFFPTRMATAHDPELSGKLSEVIGDQWFERKNRILLGEDQLGREELDEIYETQLDQGIKNIPLLSILLVRESVRALEGNDVTRAEFLCQYAKKYAPDFPWAYFTMGRVHWSRSKALFTMVLREYAKGVYATIKNFRILFFKSINGAYLVSAALLLTFLAFSIIMGLKYLSLYLYDVRKEFDFSPVKFLFSLLKVFAFVVPLLLHLSVLWALFYWTVLVWGYLIPSERRMIVFFLFVLVYTPWFLDRTVDFLEKSDPAILMSLERANYENWNGQTKRALEEWGQTKPGDPEVLFTLGLLNKREGRYDEAQRHYREALEQDPTWPECISNLGNVYLITNRVDEAIEEYQRAISLSRRKGSFYFNLHRAFARESVLSSEKVGDALEIASRLDSKLVAFHTRIYSENENRSVIDDTIGAGHLWKRLFRLFQRRCALPEGVLRTWTKRVSGRYDFVFPMFFLIFLLTFSLICSRKNFRKRCPMCGTPSMRFFARKIQRDMVCFGCNRLFVKKDSIDPKMKEKRVKQVAGYGKRKVVLRGILSLVIPGGGHLWKDHAIKGSLFVFIFFLFGLKFFFWNGMVHAPVVLGASPGFWSRFVFVLIFVLYYLGVLRSSLRIES